MSDADKLRAALERLGLSQTDAARRWRLAAKEASSLRKMQRWVCGEEPVPRWVWVIVALEEGHLDPIDGDER